MQFFLAFIFLFSPLFAEAIKVLGIGVPCMDYICQVEDDFLTEISLEKNSWKEVDLSTLDDLISKVKNPIALTGGSSANTIKGLANLGIRCSLLGNIGQDKLGERITEIFTECGISPLFIKKEAASSKIACFITPDGARSFCSYIKPEKSFLESDLSSDMFKGYSLIHIEGYRLLSGVFFEKALWLAKEGQIPVSIDLGNPKIVKEYRERILSLIDFYPCILFANEEESYALTGLPPELAARFLNNFCKVAIVKVGNRGCWVASGKKVFHSPAFPADVIDTTGAGDLFASGFLYGYLNGFSLQTCAAYGNLAASVVIENLGAEIPHGRWSTLKEQFKQIDCKQSGPSL